MKFLNLFQKHSTCKVCNSEHPELPLCFGTDPPWVGMVPEHEFKSRVELSDDQCVVDGEQFFIRGHIEIPIKDFKDPFCFSVWSSLSERSFLHMCDRWDDLDRASDPPYFGWLCSYISVYPDTRLLKLSVQSSTPGQTPVFTIESTDHPLSIDQDQGITVNKWHELAHQILQQ